MRRRLPRRLVLVALLLAVLVHLPVGWWFLRTTWLSPPPPRRAARPVQIALLPPPEVTPPPEQDDPQGQVVDIAPPERPERPKDANKLAEFDSTVPEETVDPRTRVDRQVTAETYSPEDAVEAEPSVAETQPEPATGADPGREAFRQGRLALFPDRRSLWDIETRPGMDRPLPSSQRTAEAAGAPSNDWLPDIRRSDRTQLNTRESPYANYINQIGRLISFFMRQTLANARPSVPLLRREYLVGYELGIAADGTIASLEVTAPCGVPEFDEALRQAVRLAGPFPEPPEGSLEFGRFLLPAGFVVEITPGRVEMSGIDPNSQVQFPGLLTSPR